ncbi:MAG TPA: hypothetical protein PLM32_07975 [Candidatus Competibacter sp.]|nr:hypothetical protein [Candidatus Competibacter sp.]
MAPGARLRRVTPVRAASRYTRQHPDRLGFIGVELLQHCQLEILIGRVGFLLRGLAQQEFAGNLRGLLAGQMGERGAG